MSQVGSDLPRLLAERYELGEQLASGHMTSVWRGHDRVLGRDVVVKVLHPELAADGRVRARFRQEAVNAARLTHPNIVALYDTGEQQGVDYVVGELVQGATLAGLLRSYGPLPPARAAWVACEVAQALDYAHRAGVVHRNLTPSNILLAADGSVKVGDFSIAAAAEAPQGERDDDSARAGSGTGELLSSPVYLAPEVIAGGEPDGRADLYGLGACLYEMLTGRPPQPARNLSVRSVAGHNHHSGLLLSPRAVRAGVPRELDAAVQRAVAADPADRFPSAQAMAAALARSAAQAAAEVDGELGPGAPAELGPGLGPPPAATGTGTELAPAPEPGFLRHERRWLGWTLTLVGMAAVLVVVGLTVSRSVNLHLHLPGGGAHAGARPPADSSAPLRFTGAFAFDPRGDGGDGHENDDQARFAIDQDPATAWRTQHYIRPALGGLKPGVGLVLGLDHAVPVAARELDLTLTSAGGSVEVYGAVGDGGEGGYPMAFPGGWTRLAADPDVASRQERLALAAAGDGSFRWYLVWFTRLPRALDDPSRYQDGIAEAVLRRRS
jgi:eukaryotic-like serine/threonine-protein kinase